jgi:hypothetical protein
MRWKKVTCGALSFVFTVRTGHAQLRPAPPSSGVAYSEGGNIRSHYGDVPLMFEANQGQPDSQVKFLSHGSEYAVFLTAGGLVLALQSSETAPTN